MSDEAPIRRLEREKRPAPAEWFTGKVEIESVFMDKESKTAHGRVHFHDGARTNWHLHTGDQVLVVAALGQVTQVEERLRSVSRHGRLASWAEDPDERSGSARAFGVRRRAA